MNAVAPEPLPVSVQKVQRALHEAGVDVEVVMLADAARTSQQAADALGVELGQIAKSLVFRARDSGRAVLVIASGSQRVDEKKVATLVGEKIERATPDFVREATGYAIGGVPPIGHATQPVVLLDRGLARYETVWGAAGHPHSVFPIAPSTLFRIVGGQVADVAQADM